MKITDEQIIKNAYDFLPKEIKKVLLHKGGAYKRGALILPERVIEGGPSVQFLTYQELNEKGEAIVERGVFTLPGPADKKNGKGISVKGHLHFSDAELYEEITPGGLIVDGKAYTSSICRPGMMHGIDRVRKDTIIYFDWRKDGDIEKLVSHSFCGDVPNGKKKPIKFLNKRKLYNWLDIQKTETGAEFI